MKTAKNVLCVSDLTCVGRCSLSITAPVLSCLGVTPCMLPSVFLTALPNIIHNSHRQNTDILDKSVDELIALPSSFDAIYTGFLGCAEQIDSCLKAFDGFSTAIKIVDPVMGDNGTIYSIISGEIVKKMYSLCEKADVITPNFTESSALLGLDMKQSTISQDSIEGRIDALRKICPQPIITGVPFDNGEIVTVGYCTLNGYFTIKCNYVPVYYPGTGDLFASVLTAFLARGVAVKPACELAVKFVELAVNITYESDYNSTYGVWLEKALPYLFTKDFSIN